MEVFSHCVAFNFPNFRPFAEFLTMRREPGMIHMNGKGKGTTENLCGLGYKTDRIFCGIKCVTTINHRGDHKNVASVMLQSLRDVFFRVSLISLASETAKTACTFFPHFSPS